MNDENDSSDVIGTTQAAMFDPSIPGRAVAKAGPGRLTPFQSGYVGGWTSEEPPPPVIVIEELRFGPSARWEPIEEVVVKDETQGPNDLHRLVENIKAAAAAAGIPEPRKPWMPELAAVYDLAKAPQSRTDVSLVFGIADLPDDQAQLGIAFEPDKDGNMAVFGTGGSGKTVFLRTLGIVAGLSTRGGPCHVYGLDFGARGLQMLEAFDHVGAVISGEDHERIARLIRRLRATIDERAVSYAAVGASNIEEYRRLAQKPDEPRILVLLDGIAAFRQNYEVGERARLFDMFQGIAGDGRQVGVHIAISSDRAGGIPTALNSVIQRRLVLRLATEMDYAILGAPANAFGPTTPPGRGFLEGLEVQVAVLGASASTARQVAAIEQLAARMRTDMKRPPAPDVERLTDEIRLSELPVRVGDRPVLGIADENLQPLGFVDEGALLVAGPARSGKSSVLEAMVQSVRRHRGSVPMILLSTRRSKLAESLKWDDVASDPDQVAELAKLYTERVVAHEGVGGLVVVAENVPDFLNGPAETPTVELLKAMNRAGGFFLAEGDTASMGGSWALLQAVRAGRHGVVLQPDQFDGDTLFKTPFPRVTRVEFPPGRGFYVRDGRAVRVQCALPDPASQ